MTQNEAQELIWLCQKIRHNSEEIMIEENFNNRGPKPYKLSDLPTRLAISHALTIVERRIKNILDRNSPFTESELR